LGKKGVAIYTAVKAFMSGIESFLHYQHTVKAKVKHVLTSYWQFYQKDPYIVKRRKKKFPWQEFMVDSGAYTFRKNWQKFANWTRKDFDKYVEKYCEWLVRNKAYIACAVEFDIDYCLNMVLAGNQNATLGISILDSWRAEYFQPLQKEGIDIIYVWHEGQKMEDWEDMCAKYDYVGLPGYFSSEADFNRYMAVARRYTTRVHGFAASISGDSKLVLKSNGKVFQVTIEDLYEQCTRFENTHAFETCGYLPVKTKTWSLTDDLKSSFEDIRAVIRHRVKKRLYKIKLRGGKTVTGTEDHSFFSLNRKGKLIEATPSALSKGDFLVSSLGIPENEEYSDLSSDDAEFFGVWFGDGYVGLRDDGKPSSIWVSKQHQEEIRECCYRMAERCHRNWSISWDEGNGNGYFSSTHVASWIVENFGREGVDKKIGVCLLNSSKESKAAFLRGYFSADGSAKGNNRLIELTCFRREILDVVQLMLETWDIRSAVSENKPSFSVLSSGSIIAGGITWKLTISDVVSRENFAREIGFLQEDQNEALVLKNGTKAIAGCHRGLPVSLLREPGRLYFTSKGKIKGRHVYAKDRRTAEIPENFTSKLLEMECEYLEIESIEVVSTGWEYVYDLEVPTTQRFFGNGILAHNTKQLDYRDIQWASIDSITWKTGEMYGTLIDWDSNLQKLVFEDDKTKRVNYKGKLQRLGFDADGIIADKNYKEVTRYALYSMRQMEAFYEQKYAARLFYYELRLPHRNVIKGLSGRELMTWWAKFRPDTIFRQHFGKPAAEVLKYLCAISAVQNADDKYLIGTPDALSFLGHYFPKLVSPLPTDFRIFQRELSTFISPPNPKPLDRTELAHYSPQNSPPKQRTEKETDVNLNDLELDLPENSILVDQI
jgi:intein/homing endonuclease